MNKPLLKHRNYINERKEHMKLNCSQINGMFVNPIEGAVFNEINKQLQMIDDIIEQVDIQLSLSEDFECCQEVLNKIKGE